MGQSQVSSLTVRLTSLTDDELEIKGKRRVLSELKEDVNLKLGSQLPPLGAEASAPTLSSSDGPKSVNRMLSRLNALSKVLDATSKVYDKFSSYTFLVTNGRIVVQVHPLIDSSWTTVTLLHEVGYFLIELSSRSENYLQALQQQTKAGHDTIELINVMEDSLTFVEEAYKAPDKLKSLEDTITELLKKIGECSTFVRNCIQGNFQQCCVSFIVQIYIDYGSTRADSSTADQKFKARGRLQSEVPKASY